MAFINTLYNLWPDGDEKIPGLRDGIAASARAVFHPDWSTIPSVSSNAASPILCRAAACRSPMAMRRFPVCARANGVGRVEIIEHY
jgi:hypothetical protein